MYFGMKTFICKVELLQWQNLVLYVIDIIPPTTVVGIPQTLSEHPPLQKLKVGQTIPLCGKIQADSA
jgi:hypothetical protein